MNVFLFILNSILLGTGLAMDAFSVSIANGLAEPGMKNGRRYKMAGVFGFFQMLMPLTGWICVRTIEEQFAGFQRFIPWIALLLLVYIGGRMIYEAVGKKGKEGNDPGKQPEEETMPSEQEDRTVITNRQLFIQGIATSIDALSVGFATAGYSAAAAAVSAVIIGVVTFIICLTGLIIGRKAGERLEGKANVIGGIILICIGLEIAFL